MSRSKRRPKKKMRGDGCWLCEGRPRTAKDQRNEDEGQDQQHADSKYAESLRSRVHGLDDAEKRKAMAKVIKRESARRAAAQEHQREALK